jgi:hypothetical protein
MKQPATISHARALAIIASHGWTGTSQTATFNGEWIASGSSFYEMLGTRHAYQLATVKAWLGY